jgi:hypothetical protein
MNQNTNNRLVAGSIPAEPRTSDVLSENFSIHPCRFIHLPESEVGKRRIIIITGQNFVT